MKTIAITMRVVEATGEERDAISEDWIRFLRERGFAPLLLPNDAAIAQVLCAKAKPRGLILSNGNDVGWNQKWRSTAGLSVAPQRDRTEAALLDDACRAKTPILGVCRGMQMLAAYFGGRLRRVERHAGVRHSVRLENGAAGRSRSARVNSYHNFGIMARDCPSTLEPFAHAEDGSVEAFRHATLPIVGVMWHPERPDAPKALDARIFADLFL